MRAVDAGQLRQSGGHEHRPWLLRDEPLPRILDDHHHDDDDDDDDHDDHHDHDADNDDDDHADDHDHDAATDDDHHDHHHDHNDHHHHPAVLRLQPQAEPAELHHQHRDRQLRHG